MTRHTRVRAVIALLVGAVLPPAAQAAHEGGEGLFDVQSADVPVAGSITAGVTGVGYRIHRSQEPGAFVDRTIWDGGVQVGAGFGGWLEAWTRFDATLYSNQDRWPIAPADGSVGVKIALPWHGKWLRTGLAGRANFPWGNRVRGLSTDSFDPNLTALFTVPLPESNTLTMAKLHVNVGYQWHGDDRGRGFDGRPLYYLEPVYPGSEQKDRVDLRAALEFGSDRLTLFAEVVLDKLLSDDLAYAESPIFVTPGFRMNLSDSFALLAGSKIALARDDESTTRYRSPEDFYPDWQFAFGLTWTKQGPEADRDRDGVPDFRDRCPHQPEDIDGFQDDDGCPDLDNDHDGIPDKFDQAPNQPEDLDGYLDSDGVPDLDNDGDGIPDVLDDCPDRAEDMDGLADEDGCPEDDYDGDGIPDTHDDCPEIPETRNGVEDEDGCPEEMSQVEPYLLRGVVWQGSAVAPEPVSFMELTDLAESLKADPGASVALRVYPGEYDDAVGDGTLAKARAVYLRGYLVAAGVNPARVLVVGTTRAEAAELAERLDQVFARKTLVEVVPQSSMVAR